MKDGRKVYRRVAGLDRKEIPNGYVFHDTQKDVLHFFNPTAAVVISLCDGKNTTRTIANLVQASFQLPFPPTGEVDECLADLSAKGLVMPSSLWQQVRSAVFKRPPT
jgi:hypothetical protein